MTLRRLARRRPVAKAAHSSPWSFSFVVKDL